MNTELIKTFLTVMSAGSITHAANELYVSQSTVSTRIRQLEEELGSGLFVRRRGVRRLRLTPQGESFVPIAQRYIDLNRDLAIFMSGENSYFVTVACSDSFNTCVLRPMYEKLLRSVPNLRLSVKTHQSHEIYELIEERAANIGFVFFPGRYKDLRTEKIFAEKMVFALSARGNWPESPVDPAALETRYEIRCSWSSEITRWHDRWWNPDSVPFVQMNTVSMLGGVFVHPKCWLLCPVSVARSLEGKDIVIRECSEKIPERIAYMVTQKSMPESESVSFFRKKLTEFLGGGELFYGQRKGDMPA